MERICLPIVEAMLHEGGYKPVCQMSLIAKILMSVCGLVIRYFDGDLDRLLQYTQTKAMEWAREYDIPSSNPLTYFEMMTAIALIAFGKLKSMLRLWRWGLRSTGRNQYFPLVTSIVSIDYDHMDVLGSIPLQSHLKRLNYQKANPRYWRNRYGGFRAI